MDIPKWKPDPLPERRGRQITAGRIINLWMQGSYTQNAVMTISVSHLFLDTMDYALGTLMDQERGCCSTHSIAQPIPSPLLK